MDELNFLKQVNLLRGQGDGFRYQRDISIRAGFDPATGNALASAGGTGTGTNEVQTVTIGGATAGSYVIGFLDNSGNEQYTSPIAFNALLATIQTALDAVSGGASQIVAGGTALALTLTFSGSNYAGKPQTPAIIYTIGMTALTTVSVVRTTKGIGSGLPALAVVNTNGLALQWNKAIVSAAGFQFNLPGCYDKTRDEFRLLAIAQMSGATDTPTLSLAAYYTRGALPAIGTMAAVAAVGLSANLGPVTGTAVSPGVAPLTSSQAPSLALSNSPQVVMFDLSAKGLNPGDLLTLQLTPGAHATDAVQVLGLTAQFKSDLSFFHESLR